jgi:hypothetical protein
MRNWTRPYATTCAYTPTVPAIDRVASLLREGHTLTTSTAFTVHGINALPSVIARLKAKGWRITIRRVGTVNSVGDRNESNASAMEWISVKDRLPSVRVI